MGASEREITKFHRYFTHTHWHTGRRGFNYRKDNWKILLFLVFWEYSLIIECVFEIFEEPKRTKQDRTSINHVQKLKYHY